MKACFASHRRHEFADGSVIEFCTDEKCDARLQTKRRRLLCPGMKFRPDPEPKDKAPLRPASLGVGLLALEDPESSDTEQREQIADDTATDALTAAQSDIDSGFESDPDDEDLPEEARLDGQSEDAVDAADESSEEV
jgi:hypothetical protein